MMHFPYSAGEEALLWQHGLGNAILGDLVNKHHRVHDPCGGIRSTHLQNTGSTSLTDTTARSRPFLTHHRPRPPSPHIAHLYEMSFTAAVGQENMELYHVLLQHTCTDCGMLSGTFVQGPYCGITRSAALCA